MLNFKGDKALRLAPDDLLVPWRIELQHELESNSDEAGRAREIAKIKV